MNIKKIIAREGLIILGFIIILLLGFLLPARISYGFRSHSLIGFAIIGYPSYLFIRFIIWAIKTLKERG